MLTAWMVPGPLAAQAIQKRRLGPNINTPSAEVLPVALADGDTLYLTRANYPDPQFRAVIEEQFNERLERCRGLGAAMATLARKEGKTITAEQQALIDRASGDCDRIEEVRDRELHNFDVGSHPRQVYVSRRQADGTWGPAERLPAPLNDPAASNIGNAAITSASPDRNTLLVVGDLIFGKQRTDGCVDFAATIGARKRECLPIAVARRTGANRWERSDRLRTEPYEPALSVNGAALAPDGRTVVFTGTPPGTRTDNHSGLYLTRWNEQTKLWSAPVALTGLNGAFENLSPFIGPDGRTLYFASSRAGGAGGLDIWMARREGADWQRWSAAKNLGPDINTPQDDTSLSVDGSGGFAFMSSGDGVQQDIYEFGLPPDLSPAPTAVVGGRILLGSGLERKEDAPGGDLDVFDPGKAAFAGGGGGDGDAMDERTVVFVRMSDAKVAGSARIDPGAGTYSTSLPTGERYAAYVTVPGFAGVGQVVDLRRASNQQAVTQDLQVQALRPGEVIRLNNVFFDTASFELLDESRAELDRLVLLLHRHPAMRIEVAGHTDSRDSEASNLELSRNRAAAVQAYLESAGIDPGRLESQGYGESKAVASNDTDEGRQLNRRVEFRILSM
ncbi:MAG: OmpA family protein [Vicinamibacterales bacterium]